MALNNIRIVVVDGGRSGTYKSRNAGAEGNYSGSRANTQDNKNSPLYKLLNAKQTIKNTVQSGMSPTSVFAMDMGLRVTSQIVKQTANYYISDIGRRNGDDNYQQMINRQIEMVTDPLSVLGGTLAGAAAGSMFGPIGAGVGAAFGAISSGLSLAFKYAERERAYQHEIFQEKNNQAYKLSRANYSVHTGRLR